MGRPQFIAIAVAAGLFVLFYWGLERVPPQMREGASATQQLSSTSAQALIREASATMDDRTEASIHGFERMLDGAESTERKAEVLKQLSGAWYRAGRPELAGHYAEQVAEAIPSDTTWGIAGTTYSLCLKADSLSAKQKAFCTERAIVAYETAISLAPEVTTHKLNFAIHLADNPPADNPMRGILILRELNTTNPDDVSVLIQLGRLALRTNQLDKASERLTRAVELAPDNVNAQCLLSEVAGRLGNKAVAANASESCRLLQRGPN